VLPSKRYDYLPLARGGRWVGSRRPGHLNANDSAYIFNAKAHRAATTMLVVNDHAVCILTVRPWASIAGNRYGSASSTAATRYSARADRTRWRCPPKKDAAAWSTAFRDTLTCHSRAVTLVPCEDGQGEALYHVGFISWPRLMEHPKGRFTRPRSLRLGPNPVYPFVNHDELSDFPAPLLPTSAIYRPVTVATMGLSPVAMIRR